MGYLRRHQPGAAVLVCAVGIWLIQPVRAAFEATTRTVYVTITDNKGAPVPDLTAANFKVKEGGKEREILKATPATTPPHLALMVEDRLAPDTGIRVGLFEFVKRLNGAAEISLITVGLSNNTLVPFVRDPNPLLKAINDLSLNGNPTSNLTEGISDMAKIFQKENPPRPVMVAVAFSGGQAGPSASSILTELRQSDATLFAVTLNSPGNNNNANLGTMADESGREQVLGDGSKQSGGRRIDIVTTAATQKALQQVADDLASQYMITYSLPDGVKRDKRFSIALDRKGLSVRAPSVISDK